MGMKKTEIGMIPEEWTVQRFSDTFRILNNNTLSRAELNYASGQFRNIHYGDVLILFPEVLDCTREDVPFINEGVRISRSAQALQDGDIVMADTAEDETVGKVTEVTNTGEKPVMAGLHTIPCRVKSGKFAPKWLGYYMNSHLYHDQLLPYIHGTKVSSVSKGSLGETAIVIPSIKEQEKIINAFSDIDALIIDLKKLIGKKKNVRQGTLHLLVTGKQCLSGYNEKWEYSDLGSIADVLNGDRGIHYPSGRDFIDYGIPFINAGNLKDGAIDLSNADYISINKYKSLSGAKIQKNDILFCLRGSLGKCALADFDNAAPASSLCVIRPKEFVDPKFLFQIINSEITMIQIDYLNAGSSQPNLSAKSLKEFTYKIPVSIDGQKVISMVISDMDSDIHKLEEKLWKYQKVKQGMMEELLTGKVRLI